MADYEWCCNCRRMVGVIEVNTLVELKKMCPLCNSEDITPVAWDRIAAGDIFPEPEESI